MTALGQETAPGIQLSCSHFLMGILAKIPKRSREGRLGGLQDPSWADVPWWGRSSPADDHCYKVCFVIMVKLRSRYTL